MNERGIVDKLDWKGLDRGSMNYRGKRGSISWLQKLRAGAGEEGPKENLEKKHNHKTPFFNKSL